MRKNKGFTLIEILIALFIFAILASIASIALRRIFVNKQILSSHIQQMNQLQMAVAIFRLDLTQTIDRPVRDMSGSIQASFIGSPTSITFTRTGNINPLGYYVLSNLQRVTYNAGGSLNRAMGSVLDAAPSTKSSGRDLLKGISNAEFTFYNDKMQRFTNWPQPDTSNSNGKIPNPIPAAVELQFTAKGFGLIDILMPIYADNLHPPQKGEADASANR